MQPGATMAGGDSAIAQRSMRAGSRAAVRAWRLIGAASALGLFFLSHPYWGIIHDAELYVGRAMADADPAGLGRDVFFALEGQSAFSIYPRLSGAFLRWVGPDLGALILTVAGLCAWLAALALFAATLARGRTLWAAIVVTAVVPSYYGQAFRYAEQFATPRLPAEALVLAGLGALALGRPRLSLAGLALAAAIHPLMALPGLAVWSAVLVQADRRWLGLPVGAGLLVAAAGLTGLPVAERLFRLMDPAWAEALSVNAYLFPSAWPGSAWAVAAVQGVTVLLARPFIARAEARRVLAAILAVAAAGLAITLVAADRWLVVLVVQVQPWRALWLLGLAGALTFPIAAAGLWRSGRAGQVALGCLVLGWLAAPLSTVGVVPALGAALLLRAARGRPGLVTEHNRNLTWIAVAAFGVLVLGQRAALVAGFVATKPPDASILGHVWLFWVPTLVVTCAATLVAVRQDVRLRPALAAAATAALLVLTAASWDDRPALTRIADAHRPDPDLLRLLPPGTGEVLWLKNGAGQAWRLAGRPNWASYMQGGAIVFSPELGRVWRDRMDRLVAAHLADGPDRHPWGGVPASLLAPTSAEIEAFCRAPDAPVALIVPLDGAVRLPEGLAFATYRMPAPAYRLADHLGRFGWQTTEAQAVVPCAHHDQSGALRGTQPG
jgi:hypothetical protein